MVERCKDLIDPKVKKEVPTKRITTRWNSDLACAETHWDSQAPIQSMTDNAANKLGRYHLSTTQWTWLDWLRKTLPFLRDNTHIGIPSVIRLAAYSALHVLNKYMSLLEESDIYWMAVALCPWYKTRWFADNHFSSERISYIHRLLLQTYTRYNAAAPPAPNQSIVNQATGTAASTDSLPWMQLSSVAPSATSSTAANLASASDPLNTYLSMPPIPKNGIERAGGLIQYWTRDAELGSDFARMALDVLTSPASSVDAERAFSGGRMAVNYQQHRMGMEAFRAKMAIGAWYGTPLMEDVDEALDIIRERTSTPEPLD
ncbi:hypothetical protein FRC11_005942 [Ceratobasidium sp. 423]|nr:hypothetical protein FRC11_005942 [Ceratobasidium sp. 423]